MSLAAKKPVVGIIGGTGFGQALTAQTRGKIHHIETPYGCTSAPIVRTNWEGVEIAVLPRHGDGHIIPPTAVPYRANVYALKALGCTHILASGATGSLREEIRPRDLVVPDQVIDRTWRRAASFFDEYGMAVHIEFSHPFCPTLRRVLLESSDAAKATVHDGGTYVCMEGPAFSTVAESRMYRSWGGDLIGMTCLPEAKLAREAEICYALLALPTDYDCWRPHDSGKDKHELLKEIISNLEHVTESSIKLVQAALRALAANPPAACGCQTALDMAVWSQIPKIPPEAIERLRPIVHRRLTREKEPA